VIDQIIDVDELLLGCSHQLSVDK